MELILAILTFTLMSALCLRLLVASRQRSQAAVDLDFAVSQAAGAAEVTQAGTDLPNAQDLLAREYSGTWEDSIFSTYYDEDFGLCAPQKAVYHLEVTPYPGSPTTWDLAVRRVGAAEAIYTLTWEVYYGT
jgi:hypothetical protein